MICPRCDLSAELIYRSLPPSRDGMHRAVIEAANAALQEHMSREHPVLAQNCVISDIMKEVWKEKVSSER